MKGFIPTTFFGFFSYIIGLVTLASPWLFGFDHVGGASLFLPILFGWFQIIMAIFGVSKAGMVKAFPIQMHCVLNAFSGFVLLVSPWMYGFHPAVFWPHLILGGIILFFGIFVLNSPFINKPHKMLKEGGITSTDAHEGRLMV